MSNVFLVLLVVYVLFLTGMVVYEILKRKSLESKEAKMHKFIDEVLAGAIEEFRKYVEFKDDVIAKDEVMTNRLNCLTERIVNLKSEMVKNDRYMEYCVDSYNGHLEEYHSKPVTKKEVKKGNPKKK